MDVKYMTDRKRDNLSVEMIRKRYHNDYYMINGDGEEITSTIPYHNS